MNVESLGREHLRQVSHLHRDSVRGWSTGGTSRLRSPTLITAVAVGAATLVLRLLCAASGPTDFDGAQYVIGSGRFDVTHGAPQPPGYWLYVATGHIVHVVTGLSAVHSLVLLAALASAAAAALTCVAGTAIGGRWVGVAAAAVVASAPVSWFDGSTVSTYSFDAFTGALLLVLAYRARPRRAHGIAAAVVLGLATGFRPSILPMFLLLAAIAVIGSTRTVGQLLATALAGVASVAAWFVPMVVIQPGGVHAWLHAVHAESSGAAHTSSVFYSSSGAATNIGTFGGWTLLTLGPAVVIGVVGILVIAVTRIVTHKPGGDVSLRIWSTATVPGDHEGRSWYQRRGVVLVAAIVPPVAIVTLIQFAKGGYLLAYLPAATVLFLLPVGRLLHHRAAPVRRATAVLATLAVLATVAFNVQRFTEGPGILPAGIADHHRSLWLTQPRYQAPYADTAATIRASDRADRSFTALRGAVDPATDVVVAVGSQGGDDPFRRIGAAIPDVRVALVDPYLYLEYRGLLYYHRSGTDIQVGPGGHALFLVTTPDPELTTVERYGLATRMTLHVGGFEVWKVAPGATLFGVSVSVVAGHRPLGAGI